MEKEILVAITVPSDQVEKATAAIAANVEQVERLKTQQEVLAKTVGKTDKEYIKNNATIKRLNAEIRQNERTLIAAEKATKSNDGSIRALRDQLSSATAAYNNLSKEERENTAVGVQLQKQTRSLSDELKKLEGAVGNNTRNVGNYSEGFKAAVTAQNGMAGSALKLFDTMRANPILFIVGLFTQLIQKVGSMQAVTDALNKVMIPLNTVFDRFVGIIQNLVSGGLKDFGKALIEWVVSPLRGVSKIIMGIVSGDMEQLKEGLQDVTQNFRTAANAVKGFGSELSDAWKQGERLAEITKQLTLQKGELELLEAKITEEMQQQEEIARNTAKTTAEREAAARRVEQLAGQRLAQQLKIQDLLIEEAKIKAAQNDTDDAAQLSLNKLIAERASLISRSNKATALLRNQVSALQKADQARAAAAAKATAEAEKREAERVKRESEMLEISRRKEAEDNAKSRLSTAIKTAEAETQIALNELKRQFVEGKILREEYDEGITAIQRSALVLRETMLKEFELTEEERQLTGDEFQKALLADLTEKRIAAEQSVLNEKIKATEESTQKQLEADRLLEESNKQRRAMEMAAANQTLANTLEIVGRESAAGKAVASFQAALNAYQAYTAALALPLPPPIPQILAASNLALGLAQVARINSTPPPKFADGVIGLDGPGNATSDSIDAKLSRGESVMTAKATGVFAPVLAEMERMVGNRPNYNYRGGRFARGVIGAQGMAANMAGLNTEPSVTRAIEGLTVVTKITDIDRVNKRRERVARVTEF